MTKWNILRSKVYDKQYRDLVGIVKNLKAKDPEGYVTHFKTKLLARLHNSMYKDVPQDPSHPKFLLGNTLGEKYRHWKRVKSGLPDRYRLLFQHNTQHQTILYAWMNDHKTLRKEGSKRDIYYVFTNLLESGEVPSKFGELIKKAVAVKQVKKY